MGAGEGGALIVDEMVIDMYEVQVRTLEQVRLVLAGTQALGLRRAEDDEGRYGWIEQVLRRFGQRQLGRADRGLVLAYPQRLGGYSRARNSASYRAQPRHLPGQPARGRSAALRALLSFPLEYEKTYNPASEDGTCNRRGHSRPPKQHL